MSVFPKKILRFFEKKYVTQFAWVLELVLSQGYFSLDDRANMVQMDMGWNNLTKSKIFKLKVIKTKIKKRVGLVIKVIKT